MSTGGSLELVDVCTGVHVTVSRWLDEGVSDRGTCWRRGRLAYAGSPSLGLKVGEILIGVAINSARM